MVAVIPKFGQQGQYGTQAAYDAARLRKQTRDAARIPVAGRTPTPTRFGTQGQYGTQAEFDAAKQRKLVRDQARPGYVAPPGDTTQETPPADQPPVDSPPTDPAPSFKTAYDFVPKDMSNDPIYAYEKQQGLGELDKYLAAKGLRQSGARDSAAAKLLGQIGSAASQRQQTFASNEADRYERTVQNESGRLERAGQNQFGNLRDLLQLGLQQNPMAYGYNATDTLSGNTMKQGSTVASQVGNQYNRYSGSGGGGGSASTSTPFAPGPDFSKANVAAIGANANNNAGWGNVIANLLAGLSR